MCVRFFVKKIFFQLPLQVVWSEILKRLLISNLSWYVQWFGSECLWVNEIQIIKSHMNVNLYYVVRQVMSSVLILTYPAWYSNYHFIEWIDTLSLKATVANQLSNPVTAGMSHFLCNCGVFSMCWSCTLSRGFTWLTNMPGLYCTDFNNFNSGSSHQYLRTSSYWNHF